MSEVKKYRKKPVVIEALLWDGTNIEEAVDFVPFKTLPATDDGMVGGPGVGFVPALGTLDIPTLEGDTPEQAAWEIAAAMSTDWELEHDSADIVEVP